MGKSLSAGLAFAAGSPAASSDFDCVFSEGSNFSDSSLPSEGLVAVSFSLSGRFPRDFLRSRDPLRDESLPLLLLLPEEDELEEEDDEESLS